MITDTRCSIHKRETSQHYYLIKMIMAFEKDETDIVQKNTYIQSQHYQQNLLAYKRQKYKVAKKILAIIYFIYEEVIIDTQMSMSSGEGGTLVLTNAGVLYTCICHSLSSGEEI